MFRLDRREIDEEVAKRRAAVSQNAERSRAEEFLASCKGDIVKKIAGYFFDEKSEVELQLQLKFKDNESTEFINIVYETLERALKAEKYITAFFPHEKSMYTGMVCVFKKAEDAEKFSKRVKSVRDVVKNSNVQRDTESTVETKRAKIVLPPPSRQAPTNDRIVFGVFVPREERDRIRRANPGLPFDSY